MERRHFIWDLPHHRTLVRVNDKINGVRLDLGFTPSGLCVNYSYDYACNCVAIVCARKFFG